MDFSAKRSYGHSLTGQRHISLANPFPQTASNFQTLAKNTALITARIFLMPFPKNILAFFRSHGFTILFNIFSKPRLTFLLQISYVLTGLLWTRSVFSWRHFLRRMLYFLFCQSNTLWSLSRLRPTTPGPRNWELLCWLRDLSVSRLVWGTFSCLPVSK